MPDNQLAKVGNTTQSFFYYYAFNAKLSGAYVPEVLKLRLRNPSLESTQLPWVVSANVSNENNTCCKGTEREWQFVVVHAG